MWLILKHLNSKQMYYFKVQIFTGTLLKGLMSSSMWFGRVSIAEYYSFKL